MSENKKQLVSFDFDGTLAISAEVPSGWNNVFIMAPNKKIIDLVHKHVTAGDTVILITTRLNQYMDEVREFVNKYNIPIAKEDIYNTNMSWKADTLNSMGVDIHYDDNPEEKEIAGYKKCITKIILVNEII